MRTDNPSAGCRMLILVAITVLLAGTGSGCGMGWAPYPNISNGVTNDALDKACVVECFPIFKICSVSMDGDELHEVYHQEALNGPGQYLFVTYKNGVMVNHSYSSGP